MIEYQFILVLLIICFFLISYNLNNLFQSILGRLIIFLFLILITFINKTIGFIYAAYLLVYFNNVLVNDYIPFHNVENFSLQSNNENNDITTDKINMEGNLQAKSSNDFPPFKINMSRKEPKPYNK
jgi:predicted membrane protein